MRRLCAWCNARIGENDADVSPADVTHGICSSCLERECQGFGETVDRFLDRLEAPILLIDENRRILSANRLARRMLGRDSEDAEDVRGRLHGDIIGCVHADKPGGCGRSIHCESCTIRSAIAETALTGKSMFRVPAFPDAQVDGEIQELRFLISTRKVGRFVLLQVEQNSEPEILRLDGTTDGVG